MTTLLTSSRLLATVFLFLLLSWSSPAALHAAVARIPVVAEVVEPAVIDAAKLLTAASTASPQPTKIPSDQTQVQPQVQLNVIDGVPFLSIDYN